MKLILSIIMSFILPLLILVSWTIMGALIAVMSIFTLPVWAYQEYKDLTKDGRG